MAVTLRQQETRQSCENTHCIASLQSDVITPAVVSSRLVILLILIALRQTFSELSYSRTGKNAGNFVRIVPYSSDIIQYNDACLKGNLGHKENLLYQKTCTVRRVQSSSNHIKWNLPENKKKSVRFGSVIGRHYCINNTYNLPCARHECLWGVKI